MPDGNPKDGACAFVMETEARDREKGGSVVVGSGSWRNHP